MVVVKSELLRSKAGERLCGTARTCGLPALERRSARVRTDCPATRSCLRTSASLNASARCICDELVATRLSSSISLPGASSSIREIASCTTISVGYVGSAARSVREAAAMTRGGQVPRTLATASSPATRHVSASIAVGTKPRPPFRTESAAIPRERSSSGPPTMLERSPSSCVSQTASSEPATDPAPHGTRRMRCTKFLASEWSKKKCWF